MQRNRLLAPRLIGITVAGLVIGAAAGAVLGATTSRDKLKGAIIGAAAVVRPRPKIMKAK